MSPFRSLGHSSSTTMDQNGNVVVLCKEPDKREHVYRSIDAENKSSEAERELTEDPTADQDGELTEDDLSEGSTAFLSSESDDEDQEWLLFLQTLAEKKRRKMLRILQFANRLSTRKKQSSPLLPRSPFQYETDGCTAVSGTKIAKQSSQSSLVVTDMLPKSSSEKKRRSPDVSDTCANKKPKNDTAEISSSDYEKSGSSGKRKPEKPINNDTTNKKQKTGPTIDDVQLKKMLGPLYLPEFGKNLTPPTDPHVSYLNSQLSEINRKLSSEDPTVTDDSLSPSPPPIYDNLGIRVNIRRARIRNKLSARRQKIVSELVRHDPILAPPTGYWPQMLYRKLYVPVKEFPGYNFVTRIISARRRLESESGARIALGGKNGEEDLHVYVEADTEGSLDLAARKVEKLLVPVPERVKEEGYVDPAKLFVCFLPLAADEEWLRAMFGKFGQMTQAVVVRDRVTGLSKGYGFVKFASPRFAEAALGRMNGFRVDGKVLQVRVAGRRGEGVGYGLENVVPGDRNVGRQCVADQAVSWQVGPAHGSVMPSRGYFGECRKFPFVQRRMIR